MAKVERVFLCFLRESVLFVKKVVFWFVGRFCSG